MNKKQKILLILGLIFQVILTLNFLVYLSGCKRFCPHLVPYSAVLFRYLVAQAGFLISAFILYQILKGSNHKRLNVDD